MKFGIFSNGLRHNDSAADTFDEDIEEIVIADRLGYEEGWVSEHFGAFRPDSVPNAELLIAKAAGMTKRIKLGPAVRLLPLYHPLDVATSGAMCDHMLRGRYLFGFGPGVPFIKNMERRGMTNDMRHAMMLESIDYILKCWTASEPFDWHGTYWRGSGIVCQPTPFQQPHPPISVATGQPQVVNLAAQRGWSLMVSQFETAQGIAARGDMYCDAAAAAGVTPDRNRITICRNVYVTDSVAKARADMREDVERALEDWKGLNPQRFRGFVPPGADPASITYDQAFDGGLFIGGDPDSVARQLRGLFEEAGGFGTLLLVLGKDWTTMRKRARSLKLFMTEVVPQLAGLDANDEPRRPRHAAVDSASQIAAAY